MQFCWSIPKPDSDEYCAAAGAQKARPRTNVVRILKRDFIQSPLNWDLAGALRPSPAASRHPLAVVEGQFSILSFSLWGKVAEGRMGVEGLPPCPWCSVPQLIPLGNSKPDTQSLFSTRHQ